MSYKIPSRPALTEGFSPENPNPVAVANVVNPLPVPTTCRYCNNAVELIHTSKIYRRTLGDWPWAYACVHCRAYVGLHPGTTIPLGTLADWQLRLARNNAKERFNKLWEGRQPHMSRGAAYRWLAAELGIPVTECHFGWFEEDMCLLAQAFCNLYLEGKI